MRPCDSRDTGSTLALSGLPLAVACTRCAHRSLLTARRLEAHEDDRRPLLRLPLLCRCGSRAVSLYLFETPDEVPDFLTSGTPLPGVERRSTALWSPSF